MDLSEFLCPICTEIFDDVQEVTCCYTCYCKKCIAKWLSSNKSCPSCRAEKCRYRRSVPLQRRVLNLPIKCDIDGCDETLTRGTLEDHKKKSCMFRMVDCSLSKQCGSMRRRDLDEHISNCPYRLVKCSKCDESVEFHTLNTSHVETCPKASINCELCGLSILRENMEEHSSTECMEATVDCSFKESGCPKTMKRKDVAQHEKATEHLHFILIKHQSEMALLRSEVELLRLLTANLPLTWGQTIGGVKLKGFEAASSDAAGIVLGSRSSSSYRVVAGRTLAMGFCRNPQANLDVAKWGSLGCYLIDGTGNLLRNATVICHSGLDPLIVGCTMEAIHDRERGEVRFVVKNQESVAITGVPNEPLWPCVMLGSNSSVTLVP